MPDLFDNYSAGLESPASDAFPISPNDQAELAIVTRAINVAQSGAVRIDTLDGNEATLFIAAGIAFPMRARKIYATGTTATNIVGLI